MVVTKLLLDGYQLSLTQLGRNISGNLAAISSAPSATDFCPL